MSHLIILAKVALCEESAKGLHKSLSLFLAVGCGNRSSVPRYVGKGGYNSPIIPIALYIYVFFSAKDSTIVDGTKWALVKAAFVY